jgi:hypothetical protein
LMKAGFRDWRLVRKSGKSGSPERNRKGYLF